MNIKELYRWPLRGGSFMVLGESPGHELFRGVEYQHVVDADPEDVEAYERQPERQPEFGGWIPLEGSSEEDLALEILRLRSDLVDSRLEVKHLRLSNTDWEESWRQEMESRVRERLELEAKNRELAAALEEAQEKPRKRQSLGRAEDVELPMSLLMHNGFREAWKEWLEVRREMRFPMSANWAERTLKRLAGWDPAMATAAVKKSADNGWRGTFPEKEVAQKMDQHQAPVPPYLSRRNA